MALLDRIFGRTTARDRGTHTRTEDEIAVERYQQVLGNAPAGKIESVHLEAFNKLTPAQLDIVFERFTQNASTPDERPADARPETLAKTAAGAEKNHPGSLTRTLGGRFDGADSRSFLATVAGYVIASEIVSAYLWSGVYADAAGSGQSEATDSDHGDDSGGNLDGGGFGL